MVRIRLRKVGSRAQQSFRIVTADREHLRDGRFLEILGRDGNLRCSVQILCRVFRRAI